MPPHKVHTHMGYPGSASGLRDMIILFLTYKFYDR